MRLLSEQEVTKIVNKLEEFVYPLVNEDVRIFLKPENSKIWLSLFAGFPISNQEVLNLFYKNNSNNEIDSYVVIQQNYENFLAALFKKPIFHGYQICSSLSLEEISEIYCTNSYVFPENLSFVIYNNFFDGYSLLAIDSKSEFSNEHFGEFEPLNQVSSDNEIISDLRKSALRSLKDLINKADEHKNDWLSWKSVIIDVTGSIFVYNSITAGKVATGVMKKNGKNYQTKIVYNKCTKRVRHAHYYH